MQSKNYVFQSCILGSLICWYDFLIFAAATALVFSKVFFPGMSFIIPLLVFAVGFAARPFGSMFFGHLGDKYGRKPVLLTMLFLTAASTVGIGLLPTYAQIGITAPIALVVLRIIQSAAFGGELASTSTILYEYNKDSDKKGFYGSMLAATLPVATVISSLIFAAVASLGTETFLDWGWRVPFLASSVLLVLGLYVRLKMLETPEFENIKSQNQTAASPIKTVFKEHWKTISLAIGVHQIGAVWNYVLLIFGFAYMVNALNIPRAELSQTLMYVALVGVFANLLYGWITDQIGGLRLYEVATWIGVAIIVPCLYWISIGNVIWPLLLGYLVVSKMAWAQAPSFLPEIFPAQVRQTGSGMVYNLSTVIGGGLVPIAAQYILEYRNNLYDIGYLMALMSLVALVSAYYLRKLNPQQQIVQQQRRHAN